MDLHEPKDVSPVAIITWFAWLYAITFATGWVFTQDWIKTIVFVVFVMSVLGHLDKVGKWSRALSRR